ncbi:MAG: dihydrodipicolinate synthase family protein [Gammaproteobacteria bacterium]
MRGLSSPLVALLTPFDAEGNIDWQAFRSYLTALFSWGVRSVVANGTTAEFPSLTLAERQTVIEFVKNNFQGSILNNVSSTCVDEAQKLIDGTQGYGDAVLMLPPYYYAKVKNDGLCRFFERTLSGTLLPVFLYNFPQHTGNELDNDLIEMLLLKGIEIAGIKDSSGDIGNAIGYKTRFPQLEVFFAGDFEALAALQKGLSGSITGGANPLPEFIIAIQKYAGLSGDKAQTLQRSFDVWNEFRKRYGIFEIPLLKAAMGARIKEFPIHVRAPFTPARAEEVSHIRAAVTGRLSDFNSII